MTNYSKAGIAALWRQVEECITEEWNAATGGSVSEDWRSALRDYCGQGNRDQMSELLLEEADNERRHRSSFNIGVFGSVRPARRLSSTDAARLLILANIGRGAAKTEPPHAAEFLVYRRAAVSAQLIGFLARAAILRRPDLHAALLALDYAEAMKA